MGKKLHLDPLAEREANDVGERFMHSRDVVGDMSRAYGRDLSSVQIHTDESAARRAMERGVDAFSTGKDVFFARGAFDRNDPASRGLLAHELSHSLQQGVGGASAMAQAAMAQAAPMGAEQGGLLDWFRRIFHRKKPEDEVSFAAGGESPTAANIGKFFREGNTSESRIRFDDSRREGLFEQVTDQFKDTAVYGDAITETFQRPSGGVNITGLNASRTLSGLAGALGGDMTRAQVGALYEKLLGGGRYSQLRRRKENGNITPELQEEMDRYTPEQIAGMDANFDEGIHELKALQLAQLRRLKDKYGVYGSQMHPEDFITRAGPELFADVGMLQDSEQMMKNGGRYFDYENNADDQEYRTLSNYYNDVFGAMQSYASTDQNVVGGDFAPGNSQLDFFRTMVEPKRAVESEAAVQALGGRGFTERQQKAYEKRVRKRFGKGDLIKRLFGRFAKK